MQLSRNVVHVQFSDPAAPWDAMREMLRRAAGDRSLEMRGEPLVVDRTDDRVRVTMQVRAVAVDQQFAGTNATLKQASSEAVRVLTSLDEASAFPKISNVSSTLFLYEPFDSPFHELLRVMKERYLKDTRLAQESTDFGLLLDRLDGNIKTHLQLGPMDKAQLQEQYLIWPANNLPDTLIYIDVGYAVKLDNETFSKKMLADFLESATEWQTAESERIVAEIKGG